jgi:hypothetical protein
MTSRTRLPFFFCQILLLRLAKIIFREPNENALKLLNINLIKPLLPKIVTQLLIDINLNWGIFSNKKELDQ